MTARDRIQCLLINHLLKEGEINLDLPSGLKLSLGITKQLKSGKEKCEDYCWLTADLDDKSISFDAYNLGLQFSQDRLVFEGEEDDKHLLEVI